jgi:hypothetical protein
VNLFEPWCIRVATCVSCGTRGWGSCITGYLPILREIVTGLPEFSIEKHGVCRGCMFGKHAKVAFPSNKHRSKGILDLVHSCVCGSMNYVSFIDDFARKTWIYFLKT